MLRTICAAATALTLFVLAAAPAGAATVLIGPVDISTPPTYSIYCDTTNCSSETLTNAVLTVPGVLRAPVDGTVVGWRVRGAQTGTGGLFLRVLHEVPGGFVATATSARPTATDGSLVPTDLAIAAGDALAVDVRGSGNGNGSQLHYVDVSGAAIGFFNPGLADLAAPRPMGTTDGRYFLFNADVVPSVPAITALSPASGPAAAGTTVTITGQHLLGATAVTFGSTPGTITSVTNDQIVAVAPAGTGTVGVTVTAPGGTSAPAQYTYPTPAAPVQNSAPSSVTPGVVAAAPDVVKPLIRGLRLSSSRFTAAAGTRASVTVSEASTLTFTVARRTSGVKQGTSCVAKTPKRHGSSCTRYLTVRGSLTKAVPAGASSVKVPGRLHGHALSPGTYRLSVTAKDAAGNVSKLKTTTFTIVRG